jgi:hypothetical protein
MASYSPRYLIRKSPKLDPAVSLIRLFCQNSLLRFTFFSNNMYVMFTSTVCFCCGIPLKRMEAINCFREWSRWTPLAPLQRPLQIRWILYNNVHVGSSGLIETAESKLSTRLSRISRRIRSIYAKRLKPMNQGPMGNCSLKKPRVENRLHCPFEAYSLWDLRILSKL